MKITKKVLLGLFVLGLFLFAFSFTGKTVKAWYVVNTSSEISVVGASIRTTGNSGLRFVGHIGNYDTTDVKGYGIAIAYGEATDFEVGGQANGKDVLSALDTAGLDKDGNFYVVIFGIPEDQYTQDVSARAYVVLNNDTIIYGTTVTKRNIYQVAKAASEDPNYETNAFVSGIVSTSEITALFYLNGGTISGEGFTKYYPEANQTITGGYYGLTGYWDKAYQTSAVFVVSKAQYNADSNTYAYTYRVGMTYDEALGEYKVTQIITGSGTGVVSIKTCNNSDYYLMVNTGYANGLKELKNFALGDVVTIEGGFTSLATVGAINKTIKRFTNFQVAYTKEFLIGKVTLPTPIKSLNDFVKWEDSGNNTITNITADATLYAVWEPAFEMRYYSNGGTLTGDYDRTEYYELGEDAIATDTLAISKGNYYTVYATNLCYYNQSGASADGWKWARKIGLNYDSSLSAYVVAQNIPGGTALDATNRTSEYYLLAADDYATGKNWAANLAVGKYLTFSSDITAITGSNNNITVNIYNKVTKEICVKKDSGLVTLPTPTRAAYAFDGWYENSDFSGNKITEYNLQEGYKCVYAKWHKIAYTGNVVASNGSNSTGSYNVISNNGLTVTYSALGSGSTIADGYVAFRCYEDGTEMTMGPSKWTLSTSNDKVISAYSNYSCVGLVKGAGTCTMTLTNKANPDIVIKVTVTVVDGTA